MLCAKHENATANLDRYGTEFLRRSEALYEKQKPDRSFNTGEIGSLSIGVQQNQKQTVVDYLVSSGIAEDDAKEFSEILASEEPESAKEPFGKKAKAWIASNLGKAVAGTWSAGITAATDVLKQAALKYYGIN